MLGWIKRARARRRETHARVAEQWRVFNLEMWRNGLRAAQEQGLPEPEVERYRAMVALYSYAERDEHRPVRRDGRRWST